YERFLALGDRNITPLFPPLLIVNCTSSRKSEYGFFVLSQEPAFSGAVDQLRPWCPARKPSCPSPSPPSIIIQPSRLRPLKIGLQRSSCSRILSSKSRVMRM